MAGELWAQSAADLATGIARRDFSCREVMESVVSRIDSLNGRLNAITIDLSEAALEQAANADKAQLTDNQRGPLHGVPVTIKENIAVAGQPLTNGLPQFKDNIAPADSPLVASLRNAGAIIVGRTNTPEFSMRATTWNPLRGKTVNPWHPDASPGGSSGGAGAAAAAGFGPLHHGNDIAGSLRIPSFCNGVYTIKPTTGRIPFFIPGSPIELPLLSRLMLTDGVIARSAADVWLATKVMANGDDHDPQWVPAPLEGPPLDAPVRVAVTKNSHGYPIHSGIVALVERVAELLKDAGYDVVEIEPPPITEAARGWSRAGVTDLKTVFGPLVQMLGSEEVQGVFEAYFEMGEILDCGQYQQVLADRSQMMRSWDLFLRDYPLVLTPFEMRPTHPWDYDSTPAGVRDLFESLMYSFGVNFLGLPAGLVPVDLVEGLPAGVQIIGRRYREDTIAAAMAAAEARLPRLVDLLWERLG